MFNKMIAFVFLYYLSVNSVQISALPCMCPDQFAPMLTYTPVYCGCPPPQRPSEQLIQYVPVVPVEQVTVTVAPPHVENILCDPVEDIVRDADSKLVLIAHNAAEFAAEHDDFLRRFTDSNAL